MADIAVVTSRFGTIPIASDRVFDFEQGLLGFEALRRWCLLHDVGNEELDWLQSLDDPDMAVLLVNPDQLFSDYDVCVEQDDLSPLRMEDVDSHGGPPPVVMRVVLRAEDDGIVANLRAPILFNLGNRRGMQLLLEPHEVPVPTVKIPVTAGNSLD